jgi:signal transduction histidine kinase
VDVPRVLKECVESVRGRFRIEPDAICLEADPCIVLDQRADILMVFRNLVDNAVKYAGTPPKVSVTCKFYPDIRQADGVKFLQGKAVVQITDNGQGIPAAFRKKVFGRFVRLGSELEREKPGTGLGLYIVRTLVDRLKGRVRIRDPEHGRGTIFEVQLPARQLIAPREIGDEIW